MRCRKCGTKAVIHMRQHRLALCKDHFLNWIPEQTQRFIKKYAMFSQGDRVLVAVSGGKDSLALWHILQNLGYQADGIYIGLGIREKGFAYSEASCKMAAQFAERNGLKLHVVDIPQVYGETVPEIAARTLRGKEKPCSVCGLAKRHIMNRVAYEEGYAVLATGHNLDDEAAVLLGNTMVWHPGYLLRQSPVLEADRVGLVRKVKPLFRFYERDIAAYVLLRDIEYIYDECPHAKGSKSIYYKQILNQMEHDRPGEKLIFFLRYLDAKEKGLFNQQADRNAVDLAACETCGQATTAPGKCAFCRMVLQPQG